MVYVDTNTAINVLLISSNEIDYKRIQRQLLDPTLLNCRLFHFSNVESAISKINSSQSNIDIIILDLSVALNPSDKEVCQSLNALSEEMKVVLLTDYVDETVSLELYKTLGVAAQTNRNKYYELQSLLRTVLNTESLAVH